MGMLKRLIKGRSSNANFEEFFHDASPKEQERVLKEVMRKADEDQRRVVEQYDQLHPKTT